MGAEDSSTCQFQAPHLNMNCFQVNSTRVLKCTFYAILIKALPLSLSQCQFIAAGRVIALLCDSVHALTRFRCGGAEEDAVK